MSHLAEIERFDGIILRTYPYAEADIVLRVLSPSGGKRSLIAKNARRERSKYKVNFDVFDAGTFETRLGRGSLETLLDFKPHKAMTKIRADLDTFIIGTLVIESCDLLIHEHAPEGQEFYETLALGLRALDEAPTIREKLRACFMTLHTILRVAGFGAHTNEAPSLKNLQSVIERVEQSCEKQLSTKNEMMQLLARWEQAAREEPLGSQ